MLAGLNCAFKNASRKHRQEVNTSEFLDDCWKRVIRICSAKARIACHSHWNARGRYADGP